MKIRHSRGAPHRGGGTLMLGGMAEGFTAPTSLRVTAGEYLEWLRVRNYSERTVGSRASSLRQFATWCEERAILRPGEVTRSVVEGFQRWLYRQRKPDGNPLSWSGQTQHLVTIKDYLRWLARNRVIAYNPASELELPRRPVRLPKAVLTREEVERIMRQPDVRLGLGVRDRAMLEVLYSTGVRRSELIGLNLEELDLERGVVTVRCGKGRKDRVVPVGKRAAVWLRKYLNEVRPRLVTDRERGPLFVTEDGARLSIHWAGDVVRCYVKKAGIKKEGGCHLFRHTCATLMLEGGADVRFIQELLGHSSLQTTEIYTRVSITALKAVHEATHPAEREGSEGGASAVDETERMEELEAELELEESEETGELEMKAKPGAGVRRGRRSLTSKRNVQ